SSTTATTAASTPGSTSRSSGASAPRSGRATSSGARRRPSAAHGSPNEKGRTSPSGPPRLQDPLDGGDSAHRALRKATTICVSDEPGRDRLECVRKCMRPPDMADDPSTDFGFQRVARADKARRVRGVFDSVAGNYDLMNDLMSAGAHRLWKRFTLALAHLRPGQRALDVAGGSGDLAAGLARAVGERGFVVLTDINAAMLARGRDRLLDAGLVGNVACVQANAERLPFPDASFDCVTIGFGLRNVTDKAAALASM